MSADLIAYEDCEWTPSITVVNPDGTREERELHFTPKEGAKIYLDRAVYSGVSEPTVLMNYMTKERLQNLWNDDR